MRAPISWLAEYAELPADLEPRVLADALIRVGLEVEKVESAADELSGPIVVGRVLSYEDEPQKNGKVIRWCQVDVGEPDPRGIVCGAHNFAAGDLVVVSLPGSTLPGGFEIAARRTYGHVSDGMICSVRELGIGDDHEGILVLSTEARPGADPLALLGLRETVLDVATTTDRGYTMSIRGLAREAAAALGTPFHDVAAEIPTADGRGYPVSVTDSGGCDRFSARAVTGLDPAAPSPAWMVRRLAQCGVRSISLAVDVTNYVMLETGQPLHAFDRAKLTGPIGVRRAQPGEKLTTLDDQARTLDPGDMVVIDDTGPIALAGVMGGASTEIDAHTADVVLEAAHWDPASIARTVRRHHLGSEAARRFERGVDPEIAAVALARCVDLLVEHGGARAVDGFTVVGDPPVPPLIALGITRPTEIAGTPIDRDDVIAHLLAVGCTVDGGDVLQVRPPTWRPDLLIAADLVEEVVRLAGYDTLPSVLPAVPAGGGLTPRQRMLRSVSRSIADVGYTEVLSFPFVAADVHDRLGLAADDPRRRSLRLANPLSADEPELRTSLLPGLISTAVRNVGRGHRDLALSETGLVFVGRGTPGPTPHPPGIERRPTAEQLAALDAALPDQPRHIAVILCGLFAPLGWWGGGRTAEWSDAVEAARVVARAARAELTVRAGAAAPWHPGRCAALMLGDRIIGYAGELHPRVVAGFGLPERTCAMELDLDLVPTPVPATAPSISSFPPVLLDVALVVDEPVPVADVLAALRDGAGELLEALRLFDVYRDERIGAGHKSLAFALTLRAPDRTLTVDEATAARDAAVAAAIDRTGARLRT